MKKLFIILFITLVHLSLHSQDLLNKYKTGTVKLVPDTEYAQGNDWNDIFRSYNDMVMDKPMSGRKSLVLLPDGSVIVNHAYQDYHTKFSPNGKFEKEFEVEKAGHKPIKGILGSNTLFTGLDNMGYMTCTDMNGNFKKTIILDYMAKDIIALGNNKFAVVGWVLWSSKIRSFISIVDYETNEEKIIWEEFTDRGYCGDGAKQNDRQPFNYTVKLKKGGIMACTTMPYSMKTGKGLPPQITTIDNELIVGIPNTGEILVYDFDGNLKNDRVIDWKNSVISVDEQKAIQQKAIDKYKSYLEKGDEYVVENKKAFEGMIAEMEKDLRNINKPIPKPSFSNIIKDSDGNVLFFEIPEEKGSNVFNVWVYKGSGEFANKCSFVCEDYNLNISKEKMIFKDGYIYAIQELKEANGIPLRLVRFKMETL